MLFLCVVGLFVRFSGSEPAASALHVGLQDDGGRNLVHQCLVLSPLSADAAVNHRLVSQHGGKSLVVIGDGDVWQGFGQLGGKLSDALLVFRGLSVGLHRQPEHKLFHGFALAIVAQEVQQLVCGHGGQAVGDDLQCVADGQSGAFASVVDGEDAAHGLANDVAAHVGLQGFGDADAFGCLMVFEQGCQDAGQGKG